MKPTPMMALPIVTLMMLLSSTFVRLPGTPRSAPAAVIFQPTELSQFRAVSRPEVTVLYADTETKKPNQSTGRLSSDDIRWTAMGFDPETEWNANVYLDTVRIDVPLDPKTDYSVVKDLMIEQKLQRNTLTAQDKLMRSKHIARR